VRLAAEEAIFPIDIVDFPAPVPKSTPLADALGGAKGRLNFTQSCDKIRATVDGKYSGFRNFVDLVDSEEGSSIIIVGGGSSLNQTLLDIKIKTRISKKWQIMACNKSHDFLVKNGLGSKITYATMCDPAEWISDYITPRKGVKYLLASQLHDKTLDKFLPFKHHTYVWHTEGVFNGTPEFMNADGTVTPAKFDNVREWFEGEYPFVRSGFFGRNASCIGMLALFEAVVMGASNVELHGFDSCYLQDKKDFHAYDKPKTTKRLVDVTVKSKRKGHTLRFVTNPEMSRQALEFGNMIDGVGQYMNGNWNTVVTVAGDGVIPWLAWKDGGRYFRHADPEAMQRKYGDAETMDIRPDWAVDENGNTRLFAP